MDTSIFTTITWSISITGGIFLIVWRLIRPIMRSLDELSTRIDRLDDRFTEALKQSETRQTEALKQSEARQNEER